MIKRSLLATAVSAALVSSFTVQADEDEGYEIDWSGFIKNETAFFVKDGTPTGSATSYLDVENNVNKRSGGERFKFENTVKFFFNGDIGEESSWHAELNMMYNPDGVNDAYVAHELYTANDFFREFYIDTSIGDWDLRIGKQQVVWGTADGIKLLDVINPADFREFNQNLPEDQRIPIWMITAETDIGDGTFQMVLSQHEENKFAGLSESGDYDSAFIAKGVDSITGRTHGFMNVAPAMGTAARFFAGYANGFGGLDSSTAGALQGIHRSRVEDFIDGNGGFANGVFGNLFSGAVCGPAAHTPTDDQANVRGANAQCLNELVNLSGVVNPGVTNPRFTRGGNEYVTAAMDGTWNPDADNGASTAFEYMPDAAFGTFNSFVNLQTDYRRNYPSDSDPNFGMRYKSSTEGGTNWSVNYLYAYDPNPTINMYYESSTGHRLTADVDRASNPRYTAQGANVIRLLDKSGIQHCIAQDAATNYEATTGITGVRTGGHAGPGGKGCTLVFEETSNRIHNLGGSFDTTLPITDTGMVLRGEFLYQKDVNFPVVDQGAMAIGHLTEALKMEKTDFVKYVIGLDHGGGAGLFISAQLIQFINLDYVDERSEWNNDINIMRAYSAANGSGVTQRKTANYRRYTGNFDSMHLTNGMQATDKIETYGSLFLTNVFGDSDEHRWQNIFIWENGGEYADHGFWNRFDVEYSFSDSLIGSVEWNQYFGDQDTLFGQFRDASSIQVGIKLLLDE